MSNIVLAIGFLLQLVFFASVFLGYTTVVDGAATLTTTVRHAIAGQVMVAANAAGGGGYVTEGVNAGGLTLNLTSLTEAAARHLPTVWSGSKVSVLTDGAIAWTLPASAAAGYDVTGPITVSPVTESTTMPPTLRTMVTIPVAVPFLFGTWRGTIQHTVVLPLAGQTAPDQFVSYAASWTDTYQATWPLAAPGQYASPQWFTAAAIGPGTTPNGLVPNGLWFASAAFNVTQPGTYRVWVDADDGAACFVNGHLVATASLSSTHGHGVTVSVPLAAGPQVMNVEVSNNDRGSMAIVPDGSGSLNPSALAVTVTAPDGQVVLSTNASGRWRIDAYPTVLPTGATTTGSLP